MLDVAKNVELIGFTLPATSVTSNIIPIGNDVIFVNLYSSTLCISYTVSICLLIVWYFTPSSPAKKLIDKVINDRPDISLGIRITASTALVIEFITRIANCIVWTLYIQNSSSGMVLGVWMPQIHLLLATAVQISFLSFNENYQKWKQKQSSTKEIEMGENNIGTGEQSKRRCCDCNTKSELRIFTNVYATAFALFYMLFPTIILTFAFPTQVIVIFTFVTAYLFATTICFASTIKLLKSGNKQNNNQSSQQLQNSQKSTLQTKLLMPVLIGLLFIISWLIIIYLHILAALILYTLLIGRGSVINTGPLFVISLLPSALLSGGAWIVKRVALNDPENTCADEESQTENTDFLLQNREQVLPHETRNTMRLRMHQLSLGVTRC